MHYIQESYGFCDVQGEYANVKLKIIKKQAIGGHSFFAISSFECPQQSEICPSWRKCPLVTEIIELLNK